MALNGRALTSVAVGSLFVWSGVKGWSILGTVGDLVSGKQPNQPVTSPLTTATESFGAAPAGVAGVSGNAGGIAGTALQYQGHAYRFGGAPGREGQNPWDCSSFVNFVCAVKLGLAIPGNGPGKYDGTSHGPPTGSWAVWSGMQRIGRSDVSAGDIIVWLGHMGIAISNSQMISAQNPADGTRISGIDGFGNGPVLTYGRM